MSPFLDILSGSGYGEASAAVMPTTPTDQNGGGYFTPSSWVQSLGSLGLGYISRRADIDLQSRIGGAQPVPVRPTTQNGVGINHAAPQPGGVGSVQPAGVDVRALLPFLLVAGVVFFLARR